MKNKDYRAYLGAMAENLVISDLLKHGYLPHSPLVHSCPYDILVTKGTIRFRVQVKYRSMKRGAVEVTMRRANNGKYRDYEDTYDILALVTEDQRIAYLHRDEIQGKSITLRIHRSKNNQSFNIKNFNKYKCINAAIIRTRDKSNSRLGKESTRNQETS